MLEEDVRVVALVLREVVERHLVARERVAEEFGQRAARRPERLQERGALARADGREAVGAVGGARARLAADAGDVVPLVQLLERAQRLLRADGGAGAEEEEKGKSGGKSWHTHDRARVSARLRRNHGGACPRRTSPRSISSRPTAAAVRARSPGPRSKACSDPKEERVRGGQSRAR